MELIYMYMYNVDCQNAQTRATAMYVYVSTFLSLFHYLPPSFTLSSLHVQLSLEGTHSCLALQFHFIFRYTMHL
jgi:hypothetical protein